MVIRKDNIIFDIFLMLIITASIPYLVYGIQVVQFGYNIVGGLNRTALIGSGGFFGFFAYLKDIIAVLLVIILLLGLQKKSVKVLLGIGIIFIIATISLILNGYEVTMFVVAGVRTFIFFLATMLYCIQHREILVKQIRKLLIATELCLFLQTFIVILQITSSGSWRNFGSGAYRYSGLFPGSGNLGCYCVAISLFLMTVKNKYEKISMKMLALNFAQLLFLSFASGTRSCEFLVILLIAISLFHEYGEKLHLGKSLVIVAGIACLALVGPSVYNNVVTWTGRGNLMVSGAGRALIFMDMINSANTYEFVFGRGLGVGTNVSVTMKLPGTQVSDSTINLLFTQFGLIGLIAITLALIYALYLLRCSSRKYSVLAWSFIIVCVVMFFVGNLFEHIAMCIYLVLSYYLIYIPINNNHYLQ